MCLRITMAPADMLKRERRATRGYIVDLLIAVVTIMHELWYTMAVTSNTYVVHIVL